jgi:hypothetical protein
LVRQEGQRDEGQPDGGVGTKISFGFPLDRAYIPPKYIHGMYDEGGESSMVVSQKRDGGNRKTKQARQRL